MGKVVGRSLVLCLLLLLCALSVSAYNVERAWVEWQANTNAIEVKSIAPGKSLPNAVLKFKLSADFKECITGQFKTSVCRVRFNAESLSLDAVTKNSLRSISLDVRQACKIISDQVICQTQSFLFGTTSASQIIQPVIIDVNGNAIARGQMTVAVVLDTTNPTVQSIRTGYCRDDTCYAAANVPTPVQIIFSDTVSSYNFRLVFVGREGQSSLAQVSNCTGMVCGGSIIVPCTNGEEFRLQVKDAAGIPTQEDALNPAILGSAQKVICTTASPQIIEWRTPVANGIAGQAVSGGTITYSAKVRSAIPITAPLNTTNVLLVNLTQGQCVAEGETDMYLCTWVLSPLLPGRFPLEFKVIDAVGNRATKSLILTVLNLTTPLRNIEAFTVTATKVTPDSLNRMSLDLARANYLPYPAYVTYTLTRKNPQARILRQELKMCWYKLTNETNYTQSYNLFSFGGSPIESRVLYPDQDFDKPNRLNLQIRADREVLAKSDVFDVRCQLDFAIAEGGNLYAAPQSSNITFKISLRESPLGQPGAVFVQKIQTEEKGLTNGYAKTIRSLEQARQKLDQVCQGAETLAMVKAVGSSMQGVGAGFCSSAALAGAGKTLDQFGSTIYSPANSIMKKLWDGDTLAAQSSFIGGATNNAASGLKGQGGFMRKVCRQVNCRVTSDLSGSKVNIDKGFTGYVGASVMANNNVADPSASLTGAVSTMCLGGVIYNLQKYNTVNCGYLQCLKDQSTKGTSIAVCEIGKGYQMCQNVMGEISELPYARMMKNLMGNVNGIITTAPAFIAKYQAAKLCEAYTGKLSRAASSGSRTVCPNWIMVGCRMKDSVFGIIDVRKQSNQALLGIRANPDADKLCTGAVTNIGRTPSQFQGAQSAFSAAAKIGAYSRDIAAQRTSHVEKTIQESVDNVYAQAGTKLNGQPDWSKVPEYTDIKAVAGIANQYIVKVPLPDGTFKDVKITGKYEDIQRSLSKEVLMASRDGYQFKDILGPDGKVAKSAVDQAKDYLKIKEEVAKYTDPKKISGKVDELKTQVTTLESQLTAAIKEYEQLTLATPAMKTAQQQLKVAQAEYDAFVKSYPAARNDYDTKIAALTNAKVAAETAVANAALPSSDKATAANAKALALQKKLDETRLSKDAAESAAKYLKQADDYTKNPGKLDAEIAEFERRVITDPAGSQEQADAEQQLSTLTKFRQKQALTRFENSQKFANTIGLGTDYLAKWAFDKGALDFMTFNFPGLDRISPEGFKKSVCNDLKYDIKDNDDGIIFDATAGARIVSTFGTEVSLVENETGKKYAYVTVAYVGNPMRLETENSLSGKPSGRFDYLMNVTFKDLKSCTKAPCPAQYSLTNGGNFNLTEGASFANGNWPKTSITYLPGEYGTICLGFDKPFPTRDAQGKREYCRTIKEKVFDIGNAALPEATGANTAGVLGSVTPSNPLLGWS